MNVALFIFHTFIVLPLLHRENFAHLFAMIALLTLFDPLLSLSMHLRKSHELRSLIGTFTGVMVIMLFTQSTLYHGELSLVTDRLISSAGMWFSCDFTIYSKAFTDGFIIFSGFLIAVFEGNYLIVHVLKRYTSFLSDSTDIIDKNKGMGKLIGCLERGIIYGLIISGNISAIGFVLTAKAIARFKELENKAFAEYFLVGTMLSLAVTMATGFAILGIL